MQHYDAIVLGVGGVGGAALDQLTRRGLRVLGIDQFPTAHAYGSSHGQSRIIRQAYFEHPDYVPLLKRAYTLWEDLEKRSDRKVYFESGVLQLGPPDGVVVPGVLASARQHALDVDQLTAKEVQERFPGFRCPEAFSAVFERRAGYLLVEDCVQMATDLALANGAELKTNERVQSWSATPGHVQVVTDREVYSASHLIISAGSWANDFLSRLGMKLQVVRKPLYWYETDNSLYRQEQGSPGFLYETSTGYFYGFPQIDESGLKVAEHSGGSSVADPLQVDRREWPEETERITSFLKEFLPGVSLRQSRFAVCLYTLSPDGNFIVDRHPEYPHVVFAAGLSGHGFKFASVLGEVLADLSLGLPTSAPIEFLSLKRPTLQ